MTGPRLRIALTAAMLVLLGAATVLVWTADDPGAAEATRQRGAALFATKGCVGCHHGPDAVAGANLAPDLRVVGSVGAERRPGVDADAYLRESILAPQAFVVPGFEHVEMPAIPLTSAEVDALVAYLLAG